VLISTFRRTHMPQDKSLCFDAALTLATCIIATADAWKQKYNILREQLQTEAAKLQEITGPIIAPQLLQEQLTYSQNKSLLQLSLEHCPVELHLPVYFLLSYTMDASIIWARSIIEQSKESNHE